MVDEPNLVDAMTMEYFSKLFRASTMTRSMKSVLNGEIFTPLIEEQHVSLNSPF